MNSWHKLKKRLETEFLADSLKGHITYFRTMFTPQSRQDKQDNFYTGIMNIKYDNEVIFTADNKTYFEKNYHKKDGNIFESPNNYRDKNKKITNYNIDAVKNNQIESAIDNAVYYKDFREYLDIYINMSINDALYNENPVYRMLAILDHRVGKRTLNKLLETYHNEPKWLQKIYEIRFRSEDIIK